MSTPTDVRPPNNGSAPLRGVQNRRKRAFAALTGLAAATLALVEPSFGEGPAGIPIFFAALAFIAVGIMMRAWAAIYVAGRKTQELVTGGPYARTRNPLYVGTLAAVFGAALSFGSVTMAVALTLAAFVIFDLVVRREEARLAEEFGAPFEAYARRTPRWWPSGRPDDRERVEILVANVMRTLAESLLFLIGPVLALALADARESGWVEPLLRLP